MEEIWGTNFKVVNNTNYTITCANGIDVNPVIPSQETTEWTETNKSISLDLVFSDENGDYITANLSYNSTDGVTANRGLVSSPEILLLVEVNGNEFASATLSTNGVETICQWSAYELGGNISLTFDQVV